jgi:hypothetical protein
VSINQRRVQNGPQEDPTSKHGCRLNIRKLIEEGFVARAEEVGDRRFSGDHFGICPEARELLEDYWGWPPYEPERKGSEQQ